CMQDFQLPLTF
nr:immunoglobulin light chain junction region [Macaca mulatta]MOW41346.1 immunoglobulin light chain junction region [Macaca mulatta]MOW41844.1 immunoglobulin light chain junction region [Macaca mulatta]MOW42092.1 immunoglobulin light chain junction region [Macaca mulatta]MOW42253.1 immunoglobulin light chain junction region [Macaca mulatta]